MAARSSLNPWRRFAQLGRALNDTDYHNQLCIRENPIGRHPEADHRSSFYPAKAWQAEGSIAGPSTNFRNAQSNGKSGMRTGAGAEWLRLPFASATDAPRSGAEAAAVPARGIAAHPEAYIMRRFL
jgi:hypothetical protein